MKWQFLQLLALLTCHLLDVVFAKIRTVAFDFEVDCFNPIVENASSDGDNFTMSIVEYQQFLMQYGQERGQYFDLSDPLISLSFQTIADEYCNKLIDTCDNETIPITENFDDLSSNQKIYLFHVCEEGFISIMSLWASNTPSGAPSLMPSFSDVYPIYASTTFQTYSSMKQPEINTFLDKAIVSWSNKFALDMSLSGSYYEYRYNDFTTSIISCKNKSALKRVNGTEIYCYDTDLTVHMRTNANIRQAEENLALELRTAVDVDAFNECDFDESAKENICNVYSFYPEDGNNRIAIASVGSVAAVSLTVGIVYWVRRSSRENHASSQAAFPIKIPNLPEFDEEILIEGGIHIVGTWSECSDEEYE